MKNISRLIIVGPTRAVCVNIFESFSVSGVKTILMQEKSEELVRAAERLRDFGKGFGIVAATGTGKTLAMRDIAKVVLGEELKVDIVTREHEATDWTWQCNVIVVTTGVALQWMRSGIIGAGDALMIDEIHQTSAELELTMALAKFHQLPIVWSSATVAKEVYADYLESETVIECEAFDEAKRAEVKIYSSYEISVAGLVEKLLPKIKSEKRAVAVFVTTRAAAENLASEFSEDHQDVRFDFYHGGESASKMKEFITGVEPPFVVFMTPAGQSSLNLHKLVDGRQEPIDTVVIVDKRYREVIYHGVAVLQLTELPDNDLIQMAGRVNGRAVGGEIHLITDRGSSFDLHQLEPTAPEFELAGDIERVVMACARLGVDLHDLDTIVEIDKELYDKEFKRLQRRKIISDEGLLTDYGRAIDKLPVPTMWGELILHAFGKSMDVGYVMATVAAIESLHKLVRNWRDNHRAGEYRVEGSDHLTAYNIVATAIRQFARIGRLNGNGNGLRDYYFRDEFYKWCKENGFSIRAIRDAAMGLRSILQKIGAHLITDLPQVTDEIKKDFVEVLAQVQSLDTVCDGYNSEAGTVFKYQNGSAGVYGVVVGEIRYWTDRRGTTRSSIEATQIPRELVEKYAQRQVENVRYVAAEDMVEVEYKLIFGGEEVGQMTEQKKEVEKEVIEQAISVFAEALAGGYVEYSYKAENGDLIAEIEALNIRWQGKLGQITSDKLSKIFQTRLAEAQVYTLSAAVEAGVDFKISEADVEAMLEIESLAEIRQQVERERPESWMIQGQEFPIKYEMDPWGFTGAKIFVPVEVAKVLKLSDLPDLGDCALRIYVDGDGYDGLYVEAAEVEALAEKIEKRRIELAWQKKRAEVEHTSWISDPEEVFPYLPKLLSAVEITRADDGQGDPIYGYFSLYSDSTSFQILLRESQEKAEEETKVGLERLLKKACREALEIPEEEPWQKHSWNGWGWSLTELGEAMKSQLEKLVEFKVDGLTADNILSRIEEVKAEAEKIKREIGGRHEQVKQLIAAVEEKVNEKIEAVEDSYFVESEIEQIRQAVRRAKDFLKSASYDEAEAECEKAREIADQLADLCSARLRAKQEAEEAQSSISDELYNLKYGYNEFLDATDDERSKADELSREISSAFSNRQYEVVVEKVEEAQQLITKVRERNAKLEAILQAEYATCPVCGGEIYRGSSHYCDETGQQALMARGQYSGFKVKISKIGEQEVVSLVAEYDDRYNEFEMRLEVNSQVLADNLEAEIVTETNWHEPSPREREIAAEIQQLKRQLAVIEDERQREGRVEVVFRLGKNPKGDDQLEAEGIFTGAVENRKAEDGWSEYENQEVLFVSRPHCPWLEEQPEAGQKWICTVKFQIALRRGKPVIVVNPQVRSDMEDELREKIKKLEKELASIQGNPSQNDDFSGEGEEVTPEMLEALKKHFGKK